MSVIFIYSTYDDIWLIVVNLSVFLEKTINIPTQVISCSVALPCGIYEIITVRWYFAVTDDAPTWTKCFLFHWAYSGMHTIIIDENEYEHLDTPCPCPYMWLCNIRCDIGYQKIFFCFLSIQNASHLTDCINWIRIHQYSILFDS